MDNEYSDFEILDLEKNEGEAWFATVRKADEE